jgi:hypothetical protein
VREEMILIDLTNDEETGLDLAQHTERGYDI